MPQQTSDGIPILPYEQADAPQGETFEVSDDSIPTMAWEEPGNEPYQSDTEAAGEIDRVLGAELDEQEVNHEGRTPPGEFEDVKKAVEEGNKPPQDRDLGDQEDEGDPEDLEAEPVPGEPRFDITVDGEALNVGLSELKSGYSRQANYTRKTQELAQQRRELAEQRGTADELVATHVTALNALGQIVPDEQKTAINQEIRRIQTEYDARRGQHLEAERQRMVAMDRKFADPQHLGQLIDFGRSLGFSDFELSQVHDGRLVQILDLAHQGVQREKRLEEAGKTIRAKAKTAPKLKPGASQQRLSGGNAVRAQTRRAADRLRQTGSPRDAATVIEGLLASGDIE